MKKILMSCSVAAGLMCVPAFAASPSEGNGAYRAIEGGHWFEAEALLRQELAQKPDDATLLLNLAFVLGNTGRQREAIDVYRHVTRLSDDPVVTVDDGSTHLRTAHAKSLGKTGMNSLDWAEPR